MPIAGSKVGGPLKKSTCASFPGRCSITPATSGCALLQLADEAFDAGVAVAEAVLFPEILPDALGGESLVESFLDVVPVWLAGACRPGGHPGRF